MAKIEQNGCYSPPLGTPISGSVMLRPARARLLGG